ARLRRGLRRGARRLHELLDRWLRDARRDRQERPSMIMPARLAMAGLLGFTGCFTVGRHFVAAPVQSIEKGVTTKADVQQPFGDPFRTGLDDGYESWSY